MDKTKFIEDLKDINWFENCGKDFSPVEFPITIQPVSSIGDCKTSISSISWKNATLEARNTYPSS